LKPTQLLSILSSFNTLNRFIALQCLIKKFSTQQVSKRLDIKSSQLKAILFLFPTSDRFNALNLLKNNFDIKIHLTESDIKEFEACLSKDGTFANLSLFSRKKIWDSFWVESNKEAVKKGLRPISPNTDTKLLQQRMFKEKLILKRDVLPDLVRDYPKISRSG
jgi:hypothetical protein